MRPQPTGSRAFSFRFAASRPIPDRWRTGPQFIIPAAGEDWNIMPWPTTSRHHRGYGTHWDKMRVYVLRRDKSLCQPCLRNNRTTLANAVDHIVPKAQGGSDDVDNLQAICGDCHHDKTLRDEGKRVRSRYSLSGWPEE